MRPRQWVKNVLVLAAPMAAGVVGQPSVLLATLVAFVSFSLAASGVYLINDARDVEADRAHPVKRYRPIAAGVLPVRLAYAVAVFLLLAALGLALLATWQLVAVTVVYEVVQLAYCFGLKHQPVLDICIVASGFLLRGIAGGRRREHRAVAMVPAGGRFRFAVHGVREAVRGTGTGRPDRSEDS